MKSNIAKVLIATVVMSFASVAIAQEGARSVGHGLKCSQRFVLQADGTYKLMQVCYKSI